uniref:Uncharacterized protein n=1 Tax=Lepeophtheirus salmonis TaxID=72036 RepID=A0A0K2TMA9_LEPSM
MCRSCTSMYENMSNISKPAAYLNKWSKQSICVILKKMVLHQFCKQIGAK